VRSENVGPFSVYRGRPEPNLLGRTEVEGQDLRWKTCSHTGIHQLIFAVSSCQNAQVQPPPRSTPAQKMAPSGCSSSYGASPSRCRVVHPTPPPLPSVLTWVVEDVERSNLRKKFYKCPCFHVGFLLIISQPFPFSSVHYPHGSNALYIPLSEPRFPRI
jgi:hypothetical protein